MNWVNFKLYLYPLGFVASLLFGIRFLLQWLQSEKKGYCYVPSLFWKLSLTGSCFMSLHGYIQGQFPVALVHGLNAIIAWRNINLMQEKPTKVYKVIFCSLLFLLGLSLLFIIPRYFFHKNIPWMDSPKILHTNTISLPLYCHVIGFLGFSLFSSRFIIQWYYAEKVSPQNLPIQFWAFSLVGGSCCLFYFILLLDPVNILNYASGIIPYSRNFLFCLRSKKNPLNLNHDNNQISFCLIAGEKSGDQLGASLITSLKKAIPNSHFTGVGGELMEEAGLINLIPMKNVHIMGFSSLHKQLGSVLKSFFLLKKLILKINPHVIIFIDFPDFNMNLSKFLKKRKYSGLQCHYVCPSIWAWRKKRKQHLEKNLDLLLCLLPFEKKIFKSSPLQVDYVGHPLVNTITSYTKAENWKEQADISKSILPIMAIFPGSRKKEILLNFPLQLVAFKQSQFYGRYDPIVCVAFSEFLPLLKEIAHKESIALKYISSDYKYDLMSEAHFSIAKCGTIALELALMKVPTLITYVLSSMDFYIGRYLAGFAITKFSLPNIIANKCIFPEFIGNKKSISPENVVNGLKTLMLPKNRELCKNNCQEMINQLASVDAQSTVVNSILTAMQAKNIYNYKSNTELSTSLTVEI